MKLFNCRLNDRGKKSLPSRERGLKCRYNASGDDGLVVAPFAGAWIEIIGVNSKFYGNYSRSLRGSVD